MKTDDTVQSCLPQALPTLPPVLTDRVIGNDVAASPLNLSPMRGGDIGNLILKYTKNQAQQTRAAIESHIETLQGLGRARPPVHGHFLREEESDSVILL